jgi:hypothetical protein
VFKRLLPVKATRARPLGAVEFNLLSYSVEDRDPGPNVPMIRLPRSVLVGAGAIGNGLTYVLHQLPVVCHLDLVDYQVFGDENLGTCMLIGPSDLGWPKADVLSRFARAGLRIEPHAQYLKAFTERLGQEVRHPAIALSAVDSVITRYAIQDMWPGLVINGAIGDFPLEVSLHRWGENVACMRCIYQELAGERSEAILSRETGLPSEMLEDLDSPLTEAMVGSLPESLCVLLRPHVGKRMCAVVNEPGLRKIAHGAPEPGFEPSVPFVAAMSGAMMAGEFVKQGMGIGSRLAPRFQMDALVGPEAGQFFDEERRGGCICVARRDAIDRARAARRAS